MATQYAPSSTIRRLRLRRKITPATRGLTKNTYNPRNLIETITKPSGQQATNTYDAAMRLTHLVDAYGTTAYYYDANGRLIETTMAHPKRGFMKLEDTITVTEEGCVGYGDQGRAG